MSRLLSVVDLVSSMVPCGSLDLSVTFLERKEPDSTEDRDKKRL